MQNIQFREIRNFSGVLSATALFLKQHAVPIFKDLIKIIVAVTVVEQLFLLWRFSNEAFIPQADPTAPNLEIVAFVFSMAFFVIIGILITVTYVNAYMLHYVTGEPEAAKMSIWSIVSRRTLPLILSVVVAYILLVIGMFLIAMPIGMLSAIGGPIGVILAPLLLIAGIYYSAIFIYLPTLVVIEDRNPFTAIGDSFSLIKGNWWISMGVWFVTSFIVMVYAMFAATPISLLVDIIISNSPLNVDTSQFVAISARINLFLGNFLYKFLMIIPTVAATILYFSIMEERELKGLRDRVSALATGGEPTA